MKVKKKKRKKQNTDFYIKKPLQHIDPHNSDELVLAAINNFEKMRNA